MRNLLFGTAFLLLAATPLAAKTKTAEPGTFWLRTGLGGGVKLASPVGGDGSDGHFLMMAHAEYVFTKSWSLVGGLNLGAASTVPLRFRLGPQFRIANLGAPVAPFGQVQLSVGGLFNAIGADLPIIGAHVAAGVEYFLTKEFTLGGQLGIDMSTTLGPRPAFYGTFEIMAISSIALF